MPIEAGLRRAKDLAFWSLAGAVVAASFSNSLFEIFSGVFLGLSLLLVLLEKRTCIFKSFFGAAVAVYLGVVLITAVRSGYPAESWRGVFRVLRCALMSFFTVYLVDDENKFKKIFYIFAVSALFIALDALAQGVFAVEFLRQRPMTPYSGQSGRVTGPFGHANDFAAYLSLTIFLFLGMAGRAFRGREWKERLLFFTGTLALGGCLLWTYSRGAWVGVAFACILAALLKRDRAALAVLGAVLLSVFLLSPAPLKGRIASFWDVRDATMKERRLLWTEALEMTQERPWLGYGINTYSKIEPSFKSKAVYTDNQYAHNGYLQIAAETGWLGLGAFLAVLFSFFAAAFPVHLKYRKEFVSAAALSLTLGVFSFLVHSATDTNLQSLRLVSLLWLSMGLVLAAKQIKGSDVR